jgi:hypothetical protein
MVIYGLRLRKEIQRLLGERNIQPAQPPKKKPAEATRAAEAPIAR